MPTGPVGRPRACGHSCGPAGATGPPAICHDGGMEQSQDVVDPQALLITVAPTGAETTKADCPQLPTTLAELVPTAQECEAAGAAMIHVHIRDDEHRPTLDLARLTDTVQALRE